VNQQADLSDVLSEYDDLISNGSRNSVQDQTPATIFEVDDIGPKNPNNTVAREQDAPPMPPPKPTPPHLKLEKVDTTVADIEALSGSSVETPQQLNKPLPKSPGATSPFAALFGWGNPSPSGTEFSSIPSPVSPAKREGSLHAFSTPVPSESLSGSLRSNGASGNPINYCESYLSTPPPTISPSVIQIAEMEDELKAISSELAASIRREMDLEDLVDRLQEQINTNQTPGRRTSDYFSDSGYSSAKASDYDQSREEIEKITRKSEQEKATLRLELTNKVQDERAKRKALDQQIKELVEKTSQIDLVAMNSLDANGRLKELETTCEELRRKLAEERESKTNFEDLLSALKNELQGTSNERDNLRDEIVPQLRARVEGLESEAAEYANLTYESSKMQQELQTLKQENTNLRRTSRIEDVPTRASRAFSGGLSRSNSVATGMTRGPRTGGISLSRSNSVKGGQVESREALAERLKDVEAQRDALHNALKNLLERQEFQNRENLKKIRVLESERERLLTSSPKKAGFEKEISSLRTEINVLRRRAEDALEQKWQVEKGLGGLKMDLDKAEEEIASLRALLAEKDILIPPSIGRSSNSSNSSGILGVPVTSDSLRSAYQELQASYTEALDRIKKLELETGNEPSSEKTKLAIERLERSLASAVSERDAARKEASALMQKYNGLAAGEAKNMESERVLADELSESAHQIEQLASQVQQQLAANAELRNRLSDAVARGDNERKANYSRIAELQEHLSSLEEQLVSAQSASEDRVARHEEEIARLKEAHNEQLRRMDGNHGLGGMRSSALKSPRMLSNRNSPLFARTSSIMQAKSFEEEAQIKTLKANVVELEKALADAETEMQEVVAKMSTAQIEVLNLQEEREAAVRETRRLQKILEAEQVKSFEDRFKTLSGNA
jgi:chromosome segregation ATPase